MTTEIVDDSHGSDDTGHDHGSGGIGFDPPIQCSDVRAPIAWAFEGHDPPLVEALAGARSMAISDATTDYDPPLNGGAAAVVAMALALAKGFDLDCSAALSA